VNRLIVIALVASSAGCDWAHDAFMNSIPFEGTRTDDMYVYIGYDGLDPVTVEQAVAQGAFAGFRHAKFITDFPGSSDSAWTRMLRTRTMHGYEYEYYDPQGDKLVNAGLVGLAEHLAPTLSDTLDFGPEYLHAFDYRSHGYSHNFEVYQDTWVSLGETLDEFFFQLDGRAQTDSVFFGYLMEGDVLGHSGVQKDCVSTLVRFAGRLEAFRKAHPQRKFHFTIVSDHGIDFTDMPIDHYLDFNKELPKVGVTPVNSLGGHDPHQEVYAVPILFVRLMYVALHTHPDLVEEIGRRVSQLDSVDFTVGRVGPSRYAVWTGGQLDGTFEYGSGTYRLQGDFSRFGVPAGTSSISDEALFDLTRDGSHPDLFYRTRTALSGVTADYPADVILSTKSGYQSGGAIPAAFLSAGTHGGANSKGIGVLLSEERDLPVAARADSLLDLFPRLADHLRERGLNLQEADADADRPNR
jgi:hypothetical protein